jgi:hypothetical protein
LIIYDRFQEDPSRPTLPLDNSVALGYTGSMTQHTEWIKMDPWAPAEGDPFEGPYFAIDQRVEVEHSVVDLGRTGKVIAWGRSKGADAHWKAEHEPVLKCVHGTSCDGLADEEGPVVLWDGTTEDIHWFPGQGMSALKEIS